LHEDHVSGIGKLQKAGIFIKRLFMPFWDHSALALQMFRQLAENPRDTLARRTTMKSWLDPIPLVQEAAGGDTIIYEVLPRRRNNLEPTPEGDLANPNGPFENGPTWAPPKVEPREPSSTRYEPITSQDARSAIGVAPGSFAFELVPHCVESAACAAIRKRLERDLGIQPGTNNLDACTEVLNHLTTRTGVAKVRRLLERAHLEVRKGSSLKRTLAKLDLNFTSLWLWAGGHRVSSNQTDEPFGLLWAGDGSLNNHTDAKLLVAELGTARCEAVKVAQLPHHGAHKNFRPHIARSILPNVHAWHVSYGLKNTYHHPSGKNILQLSKTYPVNERSWNAASWALR
jgi:hypothetical protein